MSTRAYQEILDRATHLSPQEKSQLLTELAAQVHDLVSARPIAGETTCGEPTEEILLVGPDGEPVYPPDFDPLLKGAVNPLAFKRGKIVGDIINPLEIEWEACR